MMTADEAGKLTELMKAVTDVGTGSAVRTGDYTAAVKTGTAEFETGKERMPGLRALPRQKLQRLQLRCWWRSREAEER